MSSRRAISAASRSSRGEDAPLPVVHTVELLDWATGGPAPQGTGRALVDAPPGGLERFLPFPITEYGPPELIAGEGAVAVRWVLTDGRALALAAKLSAEIGTGFRHRPAG